MKRRKDKKCSRSFCVLLPRSIIFDHGGIDVVKETHVTKDMKRRKRYKCQLVSMHGRHRHKI